MGPHEIKNLLYNKEIFKEVERLTKESLWDAENLLKSYLTED